MRAEKGYEEDNRLLVRFFENTDWIMVGTIIFIIAAGLIAVYSAVLNMGNPGRFVYTQATAVGIGFLGMLILLGINYQLYRHWYFFIYGCSILLLISVLFLGVTVRGTKGWFSFGFFSFQPVEAARLMFIVALSGFIDSRIKDIKNPATVIMALLLLMGHVILLLLQPDFSSTLPYFPVAVVILYIAGASTAFLLGFLLFGAISVGIPLMATFFKLQPLLLKTYPALKYLVDAGTNGGIKAVIVLGMVIAVFFIIWWGLKRFRIIIPLGYPVILSLLIIGSSCSSFFVQKAIKEYQRKRLVVFLNPDIDPLGSGYNIIQSKIALGSGQLMGRGLFGGRQTQLGFLPEQHTDYIFAVIGEEAGYAVSQLILMGLFILVWRAINVARVARDRFGSFIAIGIAALFAFNIIINTGMVMGLMPTAGLPLPLISYGGSNMASSLFALGLLFSIHIRRYTN